MELVISNNFGVIAEEGAAEPYRSEDGRDIAAVQRVAPCRKEHEGGIKNTLSTRYRLLAIKCDLLQ